MDRKQAREIGLEVWGYLRDHPEIERKQAMPVKIYEKIEYLTGCCPLCAVFGMDCTKDEEVCPLSHDGKCRDYWLWDESENDESRKLYAGKIYDAIEAWEA